mgnify:CR=1 FL=1
MASSDKDNLIGHLTEATDGDLNELEKSWDEIGITLILFDESDTNQDLEGMDELYDLKADPYEMKNVIADPNSKQTLESLNAKIDEGFSD